jgi:hypothetical protein
MCTYLALLVVDERIKWLCPGKSNDSTEQHAYSAYLFIFVGTIDPEKINNICTGTSLYDQIIAGGLRTTE